VQRTLKFVKYLSCYGWQPVVLTVKNPDSDYFDPTLFDDVPQGTVVRRTVSPNLAQYYKAVRREKKSTCESADKGEERNNVFKRILRIIQMMAKSFANNFLFIPDEYIGWLPFALWHGYRLIRKERISLIYASGNPWTDFVIAKCLSAIARVPYVIDFRDPWVLSAYIAKTERRTFKYRMSRMIEYSCIKNASCVINVNENITSIFKRYYKRIDSSRFITITNGFDEEDFWKANVKKNNRFVISHVGMLHSQRTPNRLFEAVNHIFELQSHLRTQFEIRLVGIMDTIAENA
jgi:glycosyltransferase involved in cell wall biosynthesis